VGDWRDSRRAAGRLAPSTRRLPEATNSLSGW